MSKRLYFEDARAWEFSARTEKTKTDEKGTWLALDQTIFYPEGGGQPWDTGRLLQGNQEWRVVEVQADEDDVIWHRLDLSENASLPLLNQDIHGEIDWARRFDHMQQHTGEHILANCVHRLAQGFTHGLHIGHEVSSIDVTLPEGKTRLDEEMLASIEALANRCIQANHPIVCSFPTDEDLKKIPLRKEAGDFEHTRVCAMGDFEYVACGGTHLSATGEVGLVKILSVQPSKGKMRVFFLCGERATAHYAMEHKALSRAGELLSAKAEEVPERLEQTLKLLADARRELAALHRKNTLDKVPGLLENAHAYKDGRRLVIAELTENDLPAMEALAGRLTKESRLIALLCAVKEGRYNFLFARSNDLDTNLSDFLKSTLAKGGGRPEFARGAAEDSLPWEAAKVMAIHL